MAKGNDRMTDKIGIMNFWETWKKIMAYVNCKPMYPLFEINQ